MLKGLYNSNAIGKESGNCLKDDDHHQPLLSINVLSNNANCSLMGSSNNDNKEKDNHRLFISIMVIICITLVIILILYFGRDMLYSSRYRTKDWFIERKFVIGGNNSSS